MIIQHHGRAHSVVNPAYTRRADQDFLLAEGRTRLGILQWFPDREDVQQLPKRITEVLAAIKSDLVAGLCNNPRRRKTIEGPGNQLSRRIVGNLRNQLPALRTLYGSSDFLYPCLALRKAYRRRCQQFSRPKVVQASNQADSQGALDDYLSQARKICPAFEVLKIIQFCLEPDLAHVGYGTAFGSHANDAKLSRVTESGGEASVQRFRKEYVGIGFSLGQGRLHERGGRGDGLDDKLGQLFLCFLSRERSGLRKKECDAWRSKRKEDSRGHDIKVSAPKGSLQLAGKGICGKLKWATSPTLDPHQEPSARNSPCS